MGYILYNLAQLGLRMDTSIPCNAIITNRVKNLYGYLSLFSKAGNIKVRIAYSNHQWVFECYSNTSYLFTCKELNKPVIKILKSLDMTKPQIQYTNAELQEMRDYVRENFVSGVDDVDPNWHKVMKDEARLMAQEMLREIDDAVFTSDDN